MTAPASASPDHARPALGRWCRRLTQFSLRTLLIVTALTAVACWWFLQPQTRDEELAGKHLKLRRQVRLVKEDAVMTNHGKWNRLENVGRWRLRGEQGDVLVAGRYDNDRQHGRWTTWHANGCKAAEGEMFRGVRTGLWRVWNEEGQLQSEVTYKAVEAKRQPQAPSFGCYMAMPVVVLPPQHSGQPQFVAHRHGPARAWHPGGQLQFEGAYQDDRRDGPWKDYDEAGRVAAAGEYRGGVRAGPWQLLDEPSGRVRTEEFVGGRTRAEHEQRLMQWDRQIASGVVHRQAVAVEQLAALGQHGQPRLIELLEHDSPHVRRLATQGLARQQELLSAATEKLQTLIDDDDAEVSRLAMAVVYRERPQRREALYEPLMASLETTRDRDARLGIIGTVWQLESDRRLEALNRLGRLADSNEDRIAYSAWLARLDPGVAEYLPAVFETSDPAARCFVLHVVHHLSLLGNQRSMKSQRPGTHIVFDVPAELQPLVEAAKADASPAVRETAKSVGIYPGPLGGFSQTALGTSCFGTGFF